MPRRWRHLCTNDALTVQKAAPVSEVKLKAKMGALQSRHESCSSQFCDNGVWRQVVDVPCGNGFQVQLEKPATRISDETVFAA